MSRFGPDPRGFFDGVYGGPAPWDVGGPQPELSALFAEYPPESPVLDLGCGTGDLAIALAGTGLHVLGIDFSEPAIELARERARLLPAEAAGRLELEVADALRPTLLGRRFRTVVDSGFYHLFDSGECDRLVDEVGDVLERGGRYYLLAFATEFPIPNTPRRVTEEELRSCFGSERGWTVREIRAAEFQSRMGPVPAVAGCFERD